MLLIILIKIKSIDFLIIHMIDYDNLVKYGSEKKIAEIDVYSKQ